MLAKRILTRAQGGETNYGRLLMVALDGLLADAITLDTQHVGQIGSAEMALSRPGASVG